MGDRNRIDIAEVLAVRRSADDLRLRLVVRGADGANLSLSLPCGCVNALLAAVPRAEDNGMTHRLDAWSMLPSDDGRNLVLTLRSAEGCAISFAARPWQIQAMATIAMYGGVAGAKPKILH